MSARTVAKVVTAQETSDGAGVKLLRSLGTHLLPMHDPFLMLDEFRSDQADDYIAGFPDHPHRGFETVTYMLEGAFEHKDSVGNTGQLTSGGVQWMTAGRGIIHSEMPKQEGGMMWGFQLWVNLPRELKMTTPRYQDIAPGRVPEVKAEGVRVRVIAGTILGAKGPVEGVAVDPTMADVKLEKGASFSLDVPATHGAFAYVFEGTARIAGTTVRRGQLAALGEGDRVTFETDDGARILFLAARPLHEPVARYGPFVMNEQAEIRQAISDYQSGRLAR